MVRKQWVTWISLVLVLALPFGGAAAQTATAAGAPAAAIEARPAGKLSSRLQTLAASSPLQLAGAQAQAAALSLPAGGPGSLLRDEAGRLLVDVRLAQLSEANVAALARAGAQVIHVSPAYHMVTALVGAPDLGALSRLDGVQHVQEELAPLHGSQGPAAVAPAVAPAAASAPAVSTCPVGVATTEGDHQLRADTARTTFGVDGTGIKVGILSDSYDRKSTGDHAANDVASGDLPGPANTCPNMLTAVHVISDATGVHTDEGRAMLQIVHDVAPGAQLGFATAENGIYQFGDNIRALRSWGANVIADDVGYFAEPMFQEGPVSVAISDVVASGAVYLTAAANSNTIVGGNNVTSYEAPSYRPGPVPGYLAGSLDDSCHDFNPGGGVDNTYGVTLVNGGSVLLDLQWAQPWFGVSTELDIFVTNASNNLVAESIDDTVSGGLPFQFVSWTNATGSTKTYSVHICRYTLLGGDTATPRLKWVMLQSQGLAGVEYPVSGGGDTVGPTIMGHSASQYSLSVAAAPYNDDNNPEDFSSRGPATLYFGPVIGFVPAAAITPLAIHQPDFTATDGGCTSFFGQFVSATCSRFFGTSAAAPHAAAVVALIEQTAALSSTLPINQGTARWLLQSTARSMSGGDQNSVGSGLIDALAALNKVVLFTHRLFGPLMLK